MAVFANNVKNDNRDNVTEHHKRHGRKDDEELDSSQKGSFF